MLTTLGGREFFDMVCAERFFSERARVSTENVGVASAGDFEDFLQGLKPPLLRGVRRG
jgi:hypothetical protein